MAQPLNQEEFASGYFQNPNTRQIIDTTKHAPVTFPDLKNQGFSPVAPGVASGIPVGGSNETIPIQDGTGGTEEGTIQVIKDGTVRTVSASDQTTLNSYLNQGYTVVTQEQLNNLLTEEGGLTAYKKGDKIVYASNQDQADVFLSQGFFEIGAETSPDTVSSDAAQQSDTKLLDTLTTMADQTWTEREALNEEFELRKQDIEAQFQMEKERLGEEFEEQRGTESAVRFRLGQAGTARASDEALKQEAKRDRILLNLNREKSKLINEAQSAMQSGRREAAELAFNQVLKIAQEERAIAAEARQQRAADFDELSMPLDLAQKELNIISEIPAGQQMTLGGMTFTGVGTEDIDPFFSGTNIISLMKELQAGVSISLEDPNTGEIFTVTGLKTDDPNIKTIQTTNDKGEVTITRYDIDTGKVLDQASAGQIGKTKTRAASTTLYLNQQQAGLLGDAAVKLNASVDPNDNNKFFDTSVFIEEREKYALQSGADIKDFDDAFAKRLNNINDPTAVPYIENALRPKGKTPQQIIAEKLESGEIKIGE